EQQRLSTQSNELVGAVRTGCSDQLHGNAVAELQTRCVHNACTADVRGSCRWVSSKRTEYDQPFSELFGESGPDSGGHPVRTRNGGRYLDGDTHRLKSRRLSESRPFFHSPGCTGSSGDQSGER